MRRARTTKAAPEWGRRKVLGVFFVAAIAAVALVVGLVLAVYYSILADSDDGSESASTEAGSDTDARSDIADRPLPEVDESVSRPGPLTTRTFEEILLPAPTNLGPGGVSSGFPQTPEGALAQLAAIDQRVLQSASVGTAKELIAGWAMPGGPTPESWSGVHAVAALLSSAGLTDNGDSALTVSASPEMGLIKGTVGEGFVVVCVDFVVTATLTETASVAAADCQRMVWVDGRWMIGPGPEPAPAPAVWPGTEEALRVGYRVLRDEQAP